MHEQHDITMCATLAFHTAYHTHVLQADTEDTEGTGH